VFKLNPLWGREVSAISRQCLSAPVSYFNGIGIDGRGVLSATLKGLELPGFSSTGEWWVYEKEALRERLLPSLRG
jgi:hypothetical protein